MSTSERPEVGLREAIEELPRYYVQGEVGGWLEAVRVFDLYALLAEHSAAEAAPAAGERRGRWNHRGEFVPEFPATPDASGGLSEVEVERYVYNDPDEDGITLFAQMAVERIKADAQARARREHGEKIAQAIEALPGPNLAGIARWRSIDSREGYLLAIEEATHIARSLSPDAAEGEGRGEG